MKIVIKNLKTKDYSSHCRDCNFGECGETRNIIVNAKKHATKFGHSVEYFIETGRVFKFY